MIEGLVSGKAAERGLQHCRICFKPGKDNISGKDNGVTDDRFNHALCSAPCAIKGRYVSNEVIGVNSKDGVVCRGTARS